MKAEESWIYLDSSVLVSVALGDARGRRALAAIGRREAFASALSAVECQSGLSFQYAEESAGLPAAEIALNSVLERVRLIEVSAELLEQARRLVRRHRIGIGLRTLDAIHLATAIEVQTRLGAGSVEYLTVDQRRHRAFMAEGFAGQSLAG